MVDVFSIEFHKWLVGFETFNKGCTFLNIILPSQVYSRNLDNHNVSRVGQNSFGNLTMRASQFVLIVIWHFRSEKISHIVFVNQVIFCNTLQGIHFALLVMLVVIQLYQDRQNVKYVKTLLLLAMMVLLGALYAKLDSTGIMPRHAAHVFPEIISHMILVFVNHVLSSTKNIAIICMIKFRNCRGMITRNCLLSWHVKKSPYQVQPHQCVNIVDVLFSKIQSHWQQRVTISFACTSTAQRAPANTVQSIRTSTTTQRTARVTTMTTLYCIKSGMKQSRSTNAYPGTSVWANFVNHVGLANTKTNSNKAAAKRAPATLKPGTMPRSAPMIALFAGTIAVSCSLKSPGCSSVSNARRAHWCHTTCICSRRVLRVNSTITTKRHHQRTASFASWKTVFRMFEPTIFCCHPTAN